MRSDLSREVERKVSKRTASALKREIKKTKSEILRLAKALADQKSNVWDLASILRVRASEILTLQRALNALSSSDELRIFKKAANTVKQTAADPQCRKCNHPSHEGKCQVAVPTFPDNVHFFESCGCQG